MHTRTPLLHCVAPFLRQLKTQFLLSFTYEPYHQKFSKVRRFQKVIVAPLLRLGHPLARVDRKLRCQHPGSKTGALRHQQWPHPTATTHAAATSSPPALALQTAAVGQESLANLRSRSSITHGLIQHLTLSKTCLIHLDPLLLLTWTASKLKSTTIYTQHSHLDLRLQGWNTEMALRISSKIIPECLWCVTESCLSLHRLHLIASVTSYKRKKYTYSNISF